MRKRIDFGADGEIDCNPQYTTYTSMNDESPEDVRACEDAWAALPVIEDSAVYDAFVVATANYVQARKSLWSAATPQPITPEEQQGLSDARAWWTRQRTRNDVVPQDEALGIDPMAIDWDASLDALSEPGPSQEEVTAAIQEAMSDSNRRTFKTHEEFSDWLRQSTSVEPYDPWAEQDARASLIEVIEAILAEFGDDATEAASTMTVDFLLKILREPLSPKPENPNKTN